MINILWATIRPFTFINIYKIWLEKSNNYKDIKTHVCVNSQSDADLIKDKVKAKGFTVLVLGPLYEALKEK